jgi:DNA repair protein RecN (Recombination protein N)
VLSELRVSGLGVIEDLSLVFGPGMTALTGETGAGKTLVVEAVALLLGAKADAVFVRPGSPEALVEGRFLFQEGEVVVSRAIPKEGRSRAYLNGRMATMAALAGLGGRLADLHGQHAHQSLFSPSAQRDALDSWAGLSAARARRDAARARLRRAERQLAALAGGGKAARQREAELLAFQLAELERACLSSPDEDEALRAEEERLARAASHKAAAAAAYEALSGEGQVLDSVGGALGALAGHEPLSGAYERLRSLQAELADVAAELRFLSEGLEEDPARLEEVLARRALLRELCRKYAGPGGGLAEVMSFAAQAARRLDELEAQGGAVAELEAGQAQAAHELGEAKAALGAARRAAAPALGRAVEAELKKLAMPGAACAVEVLGGADGEEVAFAFAADRGAPLLPLSKVASGGELARSMLALRLVLLGKPGEGEEARGRGPETLIFDEVDAGIGGEAALSVGRALAELGRRYQVLVVTHLPQVAAFAGAQVAIAKAESGGRPVATARYVSGRDRVVELSRMLSGQPASGAAHLHAEELLRSAGVF